jgi:hypothetical protein
MFSVCLSPLSCELPSDQHLPLLPLPVSLTIYLALLVRRPQLEQRTKLVQEVRCHALKVVRPVPLRRHVLRAGGRGPAVGRKFLTMVTRFRSFRKLRSRPSVPDQVRRYARARTIYCCLRALAQAHAHPLVPPPAPDRAGHRVQGVDAVFQVFLLALDVARVRILRVLRAEASTERERRPPLYDGLRRRRQRAGGDVEDDRALESATKHLVNILLFCPSVSARLRQGSCAHLVPLSGSHGAARVPTHRQRSISSAAMPCAPLGMRPTRGGAVCLRKMRRRETSGRRR